MEQYISKSAVLAEIESNIKKLRSNLEICKTENDSKTMHLYIGCYNNILSFINTLEVKEIDSTDAFIEKACDAYCKVCGHYHHTVPYRICRHDCDYYNEFKKHLKRE